MPKDRPEHRLYDQRIVDRFIDAGVVARKDYDRYVKSLPDRKDNADVVDLGLGAPASEAETEPTEEG